MHGFVHFVAIQLVVHGLSRRLDMLSGIANVEKVQKITDGIRIIIEVKIGPMNKKIKLHCT